MDLLSQTVPVPALVALLAGLFFLHRAWARLQPRTKGKIPKTNLTEPAGFDAGPQDASQAVDKESEFPADWWSGEGVYELERRAVFSKTWLPVLHRARFTKPGDYHSLSVAGFPIFLIQGKDARVRAFHNVCRHRAYTVTRRESGSSTVLGCRYHGWSYNTLGQLVKAPHFDSVPGFEKAQNGLFEIHAWESACGFVFVNLDAAAETDGEGARGYEAVDAFAGRNGFEGCSWVGGEVAEGAFNWKLGWMLGRFLDNTGLEAGMANGSLAAKLARYFKGQPAEDVAVFPNASFHTIRDTDLLYSLSFLPVSEQRTLVRYDLLSRGANGRNARLSENLKEFLNRAIRGLEREYQSHVNGADPSALKALAESASGDIQKQLLNQLRAHTKLEKTSGREVFPARRQPRPNQRFELAEQLCKDLSCQGSPPGSEAPRDILAW